MLASRGAMCLCKLHYIILFSFLFAFSNNLISQSSRVNISPVPQWVNKVTADSDVFKDGQVNSDYLYLLIDDQRNIEKHIGFLHYRVKILSETGVQDRSNISVSFDPTYQNLSFHSIKIIRGNQTIERLDPASFKITQEETEHERYIYNGQVSAEYFIPDVRKGDIIDYSYSVAGYNPVFENKFSGELCVEFSEPVSRLYGRIILPEGRAIQIKNIKTNISYTKSSAGNEFIWDVSHLNTVLVDDNIPSWYEAYGYIQMTEYRSWNELATWAARIFTFNGNLSAGLQDKIKQLRTANSADEDFILACIHFVQDEIRYEGIEIGENSHKPHDPSMVFKQRYGDCKDKSLLLCTMLRNAGFTCDPALVHYDYRHVVTSWLPAPSDFNHCITRLKFHDKTYWIDPTESLERGKLDSMSFPDYREALVVSPQTQDLESIPVKHIGRTMSIESFNIGDTSASSSLTVVTKYYGDDANSFRNSDQEDSRLDMEKSYTNFYASSYPAISMQDSLVIQDDEVNNIITTIEKYKIDSIWERTDNKYSVDFYPSNIRHQLTIPKTKIRKMPYGINYPVDFTQVIKIKTYDPWHFTDVNHTIIDSAFEFITSSAYNRDSIALIYHYKSLKDAVPADRTGDYIKQVNNTVDNLSYQLTLTVHQKNNTAQSTYLVNWLIVFVDVMFLGLCVLLFTYLYRKDFNIIPRENSQKIGGALILVAIGLIFTPCKMIYLFATHPVYFNLERWTALTNPNGTFYNPGLSGLLLGEMLGNTLTAATAVFLTILFFKKRSIFPALFIAYLIFTMVIVLSDNILISVVMPDRPFAINSASGREIVACAIWIPYFLIAERVKNTFTRSYRSDIMGVQVDSTKIIEQATDNNSVEGA